MAKISPVSIKYMINASFVAEGALEKPDVIGALFGQTEGLLGSDLEMRELQKEGKIGRIEVELERQNGKTIGKIEIPTALDQSETTLIAAAIETIERIGPTDATIEVEKIEDVRGKKRDFIIDRAKELMSRIEGAAISREISETVKTSARTSKIQEYGPENLPAGNIAEENEIIVVEGRADVVNLLKNGVNNVIGMNGTKLPKTIAQLGAEKQLTLFIDGDRGGLLIAQNVMENANISYIAVAPEGKEVEELTGKEILQALRKKVPAENFNLNSNDRSYSKSYSRPGERYSRDSYTPRPYPQAKETRGFQSEDEAKIKEISIRVDGTKRALILNENLETIKEVSERSVALSLKKTRDAFAVVIDGTATPSVIHAAEDSNVKIVMAKNFTTNSDRVKLLSF